MSAPRPVDLMGWVQHTASPSISTPVQAGPVVRQKRARRAAAVALVALAALYLTSTVVRTLGAGGHSTLWDDVVYNGVAVLAAALCATRVRGDRRERAVWGCVLGTLVVQVVAGTAYSLDRAGIASGLTSAVAAAGPIAYVSAYAALVVRLRTSVARVGRSVWLDGVIAALGIATLCSAFLLEQVIAPPGVDGTNAVNVVNPIADLVLLATAGSAMVVLRRGLDRSWWLLAAGIAAYAVADSFYAIAMANASYVEGSIVDSGWPIGAMLLALAAASPVARRPRPDALPARTLLAVPALCAAAAVGVLLLDHREPFHWFTAALAAATLAAGGLRTGLAFREVRALAESRRQALTDDLTGLANRRLLRERLDGALAASPDVPVALLLIDLDRFKEVNDSLGHDVGDELLRRVGDRFAVAMEGRATVARLGGDEFAVLIEGPCAVARATHDAAAIRDALAAPIELDGLWLTIDASVGIALGPEHGTSSRDLLRSADVAMYQAKARRRGWMQYDPAGDQGGRDRLRRVAELRDGLGREELVLHYQPKVHVQTGRTEAVEALARWNHPEHGLLAPAAFLPLAEQAGLMRPLTLAVLDGALRDCARWRADGRELGVGVNLSASTLVDGRLVGDVRDLLEHHGVPATALQIEITETALADDPARAHAALAGLRAMGVGLAIDDYGAGYSSLAYLRDLEVDELKLDRSFVTGLADDPTNAAIVRSTLDLARALGLRLVAEGVETDADWEALRALDCDLAQGFGIARPLPLPALLAWLDERDRRRQPAA